MLRVRQARPLQSLHDALPRVEDRLGPQLAPTAAGLDPGLARAETVGAGES